VDGTVAVLHQSAAGASKAQQPFPTLLMHIVPFMCLLKLSLHTAGSPLATASTSRIARTKPVTRPQSCCVWLHLLLIWSS